MPPIKTIFRTHHLMVKKFKAILSQRQEKVIRLKRDLLHNSNLIKILRQLNLKIRLIQIFSLVKIL